MFHFKKNICTKSVNDFENRKWNHYIRHSTTTQFYSDIIFCINKNNEDETKEFMINKIFCIRT